MMYVWNGFPLVSKRKDLSENLLVTVEKAEAALQSESKYEKRVPGNLYGCPSRPFPVHICSCWSVWVMRTKTLSRRYLVDCSQDGGKVPDTTRMSLGHGWALGTLGSVKEARGKRQQCVWFRLYKISRINQSIKTESRLVAAKGWRTGGVW